MTGSVQSPPPVLLVTGEYPPMQGGVGAYSMELGKALIAQGGRVGVLTGTRAQASAAAPSDAPAVYPIVPRWDARIWRLAVDAARRMGATWIHVQYQTAAFAMHPAINFAPWWWRRAGLRVAFTYHDVLPPYLFPKAGARLRGWVTNRPAHLSDLTIATNEGDRRHLARALFGNADRQSPRLARIPIGSNITPRLIDATTRAATRATYGAQEQTAVIGYFGFLNRSKGGLLLVEVLARIAVQLPDVRLLMIGERVGASDPTNYAYLQEVEAAIVAHGLHERVTWTGSLPDAEVSAALAACDVLVLPYLDGASTRRGTLMAGLAQGRPLVTTMPVAPLPELTDGDNVLFVPPADVNATVAATLRILRDPAQAQRLAAGAARAADAFTWESIAAAHVRSYHAVAP